MKDPKQIRVLIQVFIISFICFFNLQARADQKSTIDCKCEVLTCGPCESEIDIKFYSSKCGENLDRMKSCKKSVCEAVPNQDKCFAELGIENKNQKQAEAKAKKSRQPASDTNSIGVIETSIGKAKIFRDNQPTQDSVKGLKIFENDRIATDEDSKIKVVFTQTKDELHINASSSVFIQKYLHPNESEDNPEYKKTVIKLDLGRVRIRTSKTAPKYDHERNTFEVKTKTAVAGVRGTDFVVSYDEHDKASVVQTLAGAVEMSAQNSGESSGHPVLVSAGEACHTNLTADFSEIAQAQKIDAKDLKVLAQMTEVKEVENVAREVAAKAQDPSAVCHEPQADFKECAWFCEGNPKKESRCRTDLKDVSCIRKMCGANGEWILPTRMPSSESGQCNGKAPVKGPCGNYW